jgi:hypothetical protein
VFARQEADRLDPAHDLDQLRFSRPQDIPTTSSLSTCQHE